MSRSNSTAAGPIEDIFSGKNTEAFIGLSVGTAFADIWVVKSTGTASSKQPIKQSTAYFDDLIKSCSILQHKRVLFSQESLGAVFKKLKEEHSLKESTAVVMKTRFYDKFLMGKLSGNVAHIVTSGFEHWANFRQPLTTKSFNISPKRIEPLINSDLIFGLNERINTTGQIIKDLEMSELEFIDAKLKLVGVKRVCINLLFSQSNSKHLDQARHFFKEREYQVFADVTPKPESDEMLCWRKNMINGVLASVHDELITEIEEALDSKNIFLVTTEGLKHAREYSDYLSLIVSYWQQKFHSETKKPSLYLGAEFFGFFFHDQMQESLQSPWGAIRTTEFKRFNKMRLQPTSLIAKHTHKTLIYSKDEVGFEPGPMTFGRSFKPCFLDVFLSEVETPYFQPFMQANGTKKFHDQMRTVFKDYDAADLKSGLDELLRTGAKILADEVELLSTSQDIAVSGELAKGLLPYLKKYSKKHFVYAEESP